MTERLPHSRRLSATLLATAAAICLAAPASAQSGDPIKIGVIAEVQSIAGAATPGGAQIAADEINAKGGRDGAQNRDRHLRQQEFVGRLGASLPGAR